MGRYGVEGARWAQAARRCGKPFEFTARAAPQIAAGGTRTSLPLTPTIDNINARLAGPSGAMQRLSNIAKIKQFLRMQSSMRVNTRNQYSSERAPQSVRTAIFDSSYSLQRTILPLIGTNLFHSYEKSPEVTQILDELRPTTAAINSRIEIWNCGGGGGEFTFIAVRT